MGKVWKGDDFIETFLTLEEKRGVVEIEVNNLSYLNC